MAVKTFSSEILTSADTNTYLANSGLVYITQASATTGSSLVIDNIFSATYRSYRIIVEDTRTASLTGLAAQLRVSGAANVTTYYSVRNGFDYSTGAASTAALANGSAWNLPCIVDAANSAGFVIDIFNPFLTQKTGFASQGVDSRSSGGAGALSASGFHNTAASYTGIQITHGNNYGNIAAVVYGYRIL
jgi:hypothetical protein